MNNKSGIFTRGSATHENTTFGVHSAGLSHPFLGMGPGPLELGKIASFSFKLGKNTKFYALKFLFLD